YVYIIYFFFQAEDGIRDDLVTGVQTCALPILADLLRAAISSQSQDLIQLNQELTFITSYVALEQMRLAHRLKVTLKVEDEVRDRSEERRVGKERRCGRWEYGYE